MARLYIVPELILTKTYLNKQSGNRFSFYNGFKINFNVLRRKYCYSFMMQSNSLYPAIHVSLWDRRIRKSVQTEQCDWICELRNNLPDNLKPPHSWFCFLIHKIEMVIWLMRFFGIICCIYNVSTRILDLLGKLKIDFCLSGVCPLYCMFPPPFLINFNRKEFLCTWNTITPPPPFG